MLDRHARALVRAPMAALAERTVEALGAIATSFGADRATLWELPHPGKAIALLHGWARPGCAPAVARVKVDDVPWSVEQLRAGRTVAFRSCAALPAAAFRDRRFFAREGPRSAALVPVVVGDATAAVLVVGTVRSERPWGAATLASLERAAVALAGGLVRRRAHEALLEVEGRVGGILEASPDAVLLVRPAGRIELANGSAAALLLRTREALCAERLQDVLVARPEDAGRRGLGALDALLGGADRARMDARCGDGSTVPVELTVHRLRTPRGDLLCCGLRDLRGEVRAREEAAQLRDELAFMARSAMVAELGPSIAHELKQPLTAILSNAETAQRLLTSRGASRASELREALADVVEETHRATDILARMRELLRRRPVERVPLDLGALLRSVDRRFREQAVARSVRLSVEVAPELPAVLGDRVQLEQVATNLVLNAFDALGDEAAGPGAIAIRAARTRAGGVAVSVRDSGPGFDEAALARAFEPFFTTKPGGLGMGLVICRAIVEGHGGRLLVRNDPGRGAIVEFHLPLAEPAAAAQRGEGA